MKVGTANTSGGDLDYHIGGGFDPRIGNRIAADISLSMPT